MDKEMYNRIQEAKRYQKLALRALFPENVTCHLDVIGKELKEMAMEGASELGRMGLNWYFDQQRSDTQTAQEQRNNEGTSKDLKTERKIKNINIS